MEKSNTVKVDALFDFGSVKTESEKIAKGLMTFASG